jgi:hypothetical protein
MEQRRMMFVVLAFAAIGSAAADGLDVKTGLWEMTYTTEVRGTLMPKATLDKMTPEQRARFAAAQKKQDAQGPKTITDKTCVTEEDLRKGAFRSEEEKADSDCKYTPGIRTSTVQEETMVCKGENARHGTFKVESIGRDRIKGLYTGGGDSGNVSLQFSGKWLGTSCAGADDE